MLSKIYLLLVFIILLVFAVLLASQLRQTQQLNQALKNLTAVKITSGKSNYETAFQLANLYFKKGMHNEAIKEYTYCLEVWDKNDRLGIIFLLNRLVLTYSILKEEAIALYYCKIALSVAPSATQSLLNLNRLYQFEKNTGSAV